MGELNYYLYRAGADHPRGFFRLGDCGVGRTTYSPGIRDCLYGILYVIPGKYIPSMSLSAETIKKIIL